MIHMVTTVWLYKAYNDKWRPDKHVNNIAFYTET